MEADRIVVALVLFWIVCIAGAAARVRARAGRAPWVLSGLAGALIGMLPGAAAAVALIPNLSEPLAALFFALVIGAPIGALVCAGATLATVRAFSGPAARSAGALIGAAGALTGGWAFLLLLPDRLFEILSTAAIIMSVSLLAVLLAAVGGAVAESLEARQRRPMLWAGLAACAALALLYLPFRARLRAHITPTSALEAAGDVQALRDRAAQGNPAAVAAFIQADPAAALASPNPETKYGAAIELAKRGDRRAQPVLAQAVRANGWWWIPGIGGRADAARLLGKMGGPDAADALLAVAASRIPTVQPHTFDYDSELCEAAMEGLGELGEERAVPLAMKALLMPVAQGDTPYWIPIQQASARALCRIATKRGKRVMQPLFQALENPVTRSRAQRVFYWLRQAPLSKDPAVRQALAAGNVGARPGSPASTDAAIYALMTGALEERKVAVAALARRPSRAAVPALIGALHDERPSVRKPAAVALGRAGDRKAVPALLAALNKRELDVQAEAITALGALRDSRAIDALARVAREDPYHAESAVRALRRIGTPAALAAVTSARQGAAGQYALDQGPPSTRFYTTIVGGARADYVLDRLPGKQLGLALLILGRSKDIGGHTASWGGGRSTGSGTEYRVDVTYWVCSGRTKIRHAVTKVEERPVREVVLINGASRPLSAGRILVLDAPDGRPRVRQVRGALPRGGHALQWENNRDAIVQKAVQRLARSRADVRAAIGRL